MIQQKFAQLRPVMDERLCRLWAAAEALALGHGGITLVSRATGVSRKRIGTGIRELRAAEVLAPKGPARPARIRRPGGGRKPKT